MILIKLYLYIASVMHPIHTGIISLFYNWNEASLHSLESGVAQSQTVAERAAYANSLEAAPYGWSIDVDKFNKESIRWKFLEIIQKDFDWKDHEWTIIEVVKSGEVTRLIDYLICYDSSGAKVITYQYLSYKWNKMNERDASFKMSNLPLEMAKVPFDSGKYGYDVIVTHFKSDTVLKSVYFLPFTLSDKSKIVDIIN